MTMLEAITTPAGVLAAAEAMAPDIAARAAEIEAARALPPDLLEQLVAAGCFRVLRPASHHGLGADLAATMRVIEALARADASVGWTVMIGGAQFCDLVELPRETFDTIYSGPEVICAGAFSPSGAIAPTGDGGYRVTGRWSFASGIGHAAWIYGNCVEAVVDSRPRLRAAVFAPDQVTIEDTWNSSGLRGTGSHHFHADDVALPAARTWVPLAGNPCLDAPVVHVPVPSLFAVQIAAVALGAAQGALDDLLALAADKVPLLAGSTLARNPLFRYELAGADTELRAARALLYDTAEELWDTATSAVPATLEQRARSRAAAVWATTRAAAVVESAYRSGGGSSVYADCPLQRRLRDVQAVTQHFLVKPDTLTTAGAILAGGDLDVPVF